jgi:membrane-bound serine protease (ClpP class)
LMGAGIIMASQNHWIPQSPRAMVHLRDSLLVLVGSGAVSLIGMVILSRYYGSVPILNRLVLRTPTATQAVSSTGKEQPLPPVRRFQANVGDWGVSDSPLRPAGKAIFGDDYLDVVTDGSFVERGRQVRIIEISGNRIVVREIESKD